MREWRRLGDSLWGYIEIEYRGGGDSRVSE